MYTIKIIKFILFYYENAKLLYFITCLRIQITGIIFSK